VWVETAGQKGSPFKNQKAWGQDDIYLNTSPLSSGEAGMCSRNWLSPEWRWPLPKNIKWPCYVGVKLLELPISSVSLEPIIPASSLHKPVPTTLAPAVSSFFIHSEPPNWEHWKFGFVWEPVCKALESWSLSEEVPTKILRLGLAQQQLL
jgi:hypothetical protein